MSQLFHGDCLEVLQDIDDESVDFIFCDLPYGQTSCKWDCPIDLDKFWIEIMRVKKLHTPIFMTTTTKFGVNLITSAPKKCPFRYDLVWVKSAPAGFLSAKKMPMRKHEMVYAFYEKLPLYDLSSHTHKFIKAVPTKRAGKDGVDNKGMIKNRCKSGMETQTKYDPPLPTSVQKEEGVKEELQKEDSCYGDIPKTGAGKDAHSAQYDPPLPVSVVKENGLCKNYKAERVYYYDENGNKLDGKDGTQTKYNPPLPNSILEIKTTRGKHSTEKPVALMEWLLKYYSKEGDVVLDPTMGSGSTGVACKNMNRNFIGIEMDDEIYEVACNRIES